MRCWRRSGRRARATSVPARASCVCACPRTPFRGPQARRDARILNPGSCQGSQCRRRARLPHRTSSSASSARWPPTESGRSGTQIGDVLRSGRHVGRRDGSFAAKDRGQQCSWGFHAPKLLPGRRQAYLPLIGKFAGTGGCRHSGEAQAQFGALWGRIGRYLWNRAWLASVN